MPPRDERRTALKIAPLAAAATNPACQLQRLLGGASLIERPLVLPKDRGNSLEETDDGLWTIYFNTILLTTFDERDYIITG
jgi:hypothetical protein